jgi:hypothetical protein
MRVLNRYLVIIFLSAASTVPARADTVNVLFVGNSYTFGRVEPVLGYNASNVHDLTAAFNAISPAGTNSFPVGTPNEGWFEQHPWGGVPGIFKMMTEEAGLDYDVSLSTRNAASLRGQFLDTANSAWKLRENVATRPWDVVVLQEQSDAALPPGKGKNANLATFNAYADQFERFIHSGDVTGGTGSYTESQLFGSLSACQATGLSRTSCNLSRVIPANANANAAARVYLEQTWARPDMVFPHLITTADVTTADGRPIVDTSVAGGAAQLYYPTLQDLTSDLHKSFFDKASSNPGFAGVAPVGDAFQTAVKQGFVKGTGFYRADGTYDDSGLIDLWWLDRLHASKYGSYLSALVLFATITGRNPLSLGATEQAGADLGIDPQLAARLQRVAQLTVAPDTTAPSSDGTASPLPNSNGWNNANVAVTLTAADEVNGSGVAQIAYTTSGAQVVSGAVAADHASIAVSAEGATTITWFATDNAENAEVPHTLVVRLDKTPPAIAGMPAAPCSLWPPDHELVRVGTVTASDALSGTSAFDAAVSSNEPGDQQAITSGAGLDPRTISLRAERLGSGVGRVYTVSATAVDRAGNASTIAATCVVRHDNGK